MLDCPGLSLCQVMVGQRIGLGAAINYVGGTVRYQDLVDVRIVANVRNVLTHLADCF